MCTALTTIGTDTGIVQDCATLIPDTPARVRIRTVPTWRSETTLLCKQGAWSIPPSPRHCCGVTCPELQLRGRNRRAITALEPEIRDLEEWRDLWMQTEVEGRKRLSSTLLQALSAAVS
jgi:hypothetical protein